MSKHEPWVKFCRCAACGKTVVLAWNDKTTLRCPCGGELER